MSRTTEFVLGLIGGIVGIIGSFFALFVGGVDAALSDTGTSSIIGGGWMAMFLSVLGIIGAVMVRGKPKVGGILMLIAAIGGFISIFMAYFLSGVLLLIAGLMGVFRKEKDQPGVA